MLNKILFFRLMLQTLPSATYFPRISLGHNRFYYDFTFMVCATQTEYVYCIESPKRNMRTKKKNDILT